MASEISQQAPKPHQESNKADSLDIPQRIERKLAQYNTSRNIAKRWMFEIISWTTGAACMAAIIGILAYLKDQPLNKWPVGLTINNVLSKVASAALILPISEAIGQLKWNWFHGAKSKEIFDFEIFDKASRGPWGSLMLLFRTKGRSLAALGATLTLLLLATDTFFQQVTELPERWTLSGNGKISRIIRYDRAYDKIYRNGTEFFQEDPALSTVMRSFFFSNGSQPVLFGNGTQPDFPLSCPTSKCEWEPYESLGVCSACADVSHLLTYACLETRLDWLSNLTGYGSEDTYPNGTACGYFLNATSDAPILMSGYRADSNHPDAVPGEALLLRTLPLIDIMDRAPLFGDGSINFKKIHIPLVNALIVSAANGSATSVYQKTPPVAQECMLSWCVKTIQSSYSFGSYKEEVLDTFLNETRSEQPFPFWAKTYLLQGYSVTDHRFRSNISIYTPTTNRNTDGFGVSNNTFLSTVFILDEMFPSTMTVASASAAPIMRVKFWFINQNHVRDVGFSPWLSPNNVTRHMERLATAMTNVMRSYTQGRGHGFVIGNAYSPITFISVQWEWLAFPITLLLLCLVFLIATIYKTSSVESQSTGIWKTSAMPSLIYSLPKDLQKEFTAPETWADSSHVRTKRVKVKLHPNKGWRVSGHAYTPTTPNFGIGPVPPR